MVDFHVNAIQDRLTSQSQKAAQEVQRQQSAQEQAAQVEKSNVKNQVQTQRTEEVKDKDEIQGVVSQMNSVVQSLGKDIRFSMHGDGPGKQVVVQVLDPATGKVVRTIPSEEFLEMKDSLSQNLGIIFNQEG